MLTDELHNFLFEQWENTLQSFEVDATSIAQVFNNLIQAYSTPNRYYHTLKHINHILNKIQTLQADTKDLSTTQLAAWFHDVVYDTQAQDNEEKSANYATQVLKSLGISLSYINTVKRLILNTKHHKAAADDIDSQVLLDADLAILAADPDEYEEYANAIRREYAWVSDIDYIQGRKQVLEKFLQRERIYFTPMMFASAEQSARANMQGEIHRLSGYGG
ncbi:hypothetical protein [Nostoc sp. TCL26-01]|uniref:HD domain-containing protein n=1 Tax=Nostoc sp. TCL26-01 TaxID=2576904 RepID=UPI0015BE9C1C|nr:hypothetical protein [Nostoc sp. TCL26-01]QLE59044.1 hypothetical protein FD725_28235 [Nostoc sp. TCL26-01]